jgi:hypothetical protein
MSCDVIGIGEYSTTITLAFRGSPGAPVLDSWSGIEVTLVPDSEVARRRTIIANGLRSLANAKCAP